MPKRDLAQLAAHIVEQATREERPKPSKKSEAGRAAGIKGGPARAAKLSRERRSEIARRAAEARWERR